MFDLLGNELHYIKVTKSDCFWLNLISAQKCFKKYFNNNFTFVIKAAQNIKHAIAIFSLTCIIIKLSVAHSLKSVIDLEI